MEIKKQGSRNFVQWKRYIEGALGMEEYYYFFCEAPTISRKAGFFIWNVSKQWQIEISDLESGHSTL